MFGKGQIEEKGQQKPNDLFCVCHNNPPAELEFKNNKTWNLTIRLFTVVRHLPLPINCRVIIG
jgi:hypothetical protein